MRKNLLLFFTLIASFVISRIMGNIIFFDGKTLRINKEIIEQIVHQLNVRPISPSVSALPTVEISKATPTQTVGSIESLAKCLRDVNFRMYGTPDCSACALQREYFGQYFTLVPYIDCYQQRELCQSKNITGYPIWEDRNGNKHKGAIPLNILVQLSGCPGPK